MLQSLTIYKISSLNFKTLQVFQRKKMQEKRDNLFKRLRVQTQKKISW